LFASKPHFLDGDAWLREQVNGLEPVRELHDTIVDVEPITGNHTTEESGLNVESLGLPLRANERLQISAHIQPILMSYPNLREAYVPVVWSDEVLTET